MVDNEPVTLANEGARIKRLEGDLNEATKAQEAAISTMEKRKRDAPIEELLTLSDVVRAAKSKCDGIQGTINGAKRTIAKLEWDQKSLKLTSTINPIASSVRSLVVNAKSIMTEFKVEGLVITVTNAGKDDVAVSVKPIGPDVPKPPSKRGGGGGSRKGQPLTVDGQEYPSASAALKAYEPDSGPLSRSAIVSKLEGAGKTVS